MRCLECGTGTLLAVEATQMLYVVDEEDSTLYLGEQSLEAGKFHVECLNPECSAVYTEPKIEWGVDHGMIGAKLVSLGRKEDVTNGDSEADS